MSDTWYRHRDPELDMLLALTDAPELHWHLDTARVIGVMRIGYERARRDWLRRPWWRPPPGRSWAIPLSTMPRDPGLCLAETGQLDLDAP